MANNMGELTGRMVGRVIRGEDIERVLAQVPEQVWQWEEDWGFKGGLADIETPMAKRREIISHILCALPD